MYKKGTGLISYSYAKSLQDPPMSIRMPAPSNMLSEDIDNASAVRNLQALNGEREYVKAQ